MKRGEVRYYQFAAPDKRRPVLILTRDSGIRHLNDVVASITSTVRGLPTEVRLEEVVGMPRLCAINLDHIQLVPKHRIGDRVAELGAGKLEAVERAMLFALGFRDQV
jgi:mRNA interferase MazF